MAKQSNPKYEMKTQPSFIDLTQRPPRSFRVRLGGFVILARMLDKGRATLSKKNGEYNYNSPIDPNLGYQIEKRAHEIWLSSGCSHGDEVADWPQTENKVLAERQKNPNQTL